jgi:hypothetical protein
VIKLEYEGRQIATSYYPNELGTSFLKISTNKKSSSILFLVLRKVNIEKEAFAFNLSRIYELLSRKILCSQE